MGEAIAFRRNGGWVTVGGSGLPLVLLASPLARGATYRPTAAALARHFRVFTVEYPDIRKTHGWTVNECAAWTATLLTDLGPARPVVVGHSYTGAVAVLVAARHPELVRGLAVVDSIGSGPHPVARALAGMAHDSFREGDVVAERWPDTVGQFVKSPRGFLRRVRESLTLDVRAEAARVRVPTLVAWGSRDRTIRPSHAAEFVRAMPQARLYVSEQGGHAWPVARPGEFAAAISRVWRNGRQADHSQES